MQFNFVKVRFYGNILHGCYLIASSEEIPGQCIRIGCKSCNLVRLYVAISYLVHEIRPSMHRS